MNSLEAEIEKAFDYRGDVTIHLKEGSSVEGYLFNRNARGSSSGPAPFVEVMLKEGNDRRRIPYDAIQSIALTGEDTAAGKSWEEWVAKEETRKKAQPGGV